jgi:hypothetical protein
MDPELHGASRAGEWSETKRVRVAWLVTLVMMAGIILLSLLVAFGLL